MSLLDLERNYSFYGAYHKNSTNVVIHMVFVWPIMFTAMMLLDYSAPLAPGPLPYFPGSQYVVLNWSFVVASIYSTYYVLLDRKVGLLATILVAGCFVGAQVAFQTLGSGNAWKVASVAQVTSWTAQFVGHGVFEKRAPALLDNLLQAFLMAPFFVLLEFLESGFGYEPNPGFKARVDRRVQENIATYRAKKIK